MRRRFADEIAQALDALLFASPSQRSRRRLADELAQLPRAEQDLVLHWAQIIAQTDPELAWQLCARASRAFNRAGGLSAEQFVAWVQAALAEHDAALLVGASANVPPVLDQLDSFLATQNTTAPRYEALASRLALFVTAMSAGQLRIQVGDGAWTDGATVFLPAALTAGQSDAHYRALAALSCLQWQSGGLAEDIESALAAADAATLAWYAALESHRLQALIRDRYPGLASALPPLPPLTDVANTAPSADATPAHSLALAQSYAGRGWPAPVSDLRVDFAAVRAARRVLVAEAPPRHATNQFRGAGSGAAPAQPRGQALDIALPADNGSDAGLAAPGGGDEAPPAHEETTPAPAPEAAVGALRPAGHGHWRATTGRDAEPAGEPETVCDARYDEWDYRRQSYRRQWSWLYRVPPPLGDAEWVDAVLQRHRPAVAAIRRRFESLRAAPHWQRRQPDGEEIDLDALVDAYAERVGKVGTTAAGEIDTRLFRRQQRQRRSLAVAFLVDMSGSTKGWVNEAEREALVLLAEALERLGDRYAILGFSGWTHRRCDIYPIKEFTEAYDAGVKARIAGIEARDYTRMGPAIRHATALLARQPERHKLLVCISDGRPDDFGDEYRGRYGIEDTRRALQEGQQAGVRNYCITVDRHAADYLPQLYGRAHYSVLADARALPLRIAQVYRRLVR